MHFRFATTADTAEILDIYKPYVEKTAITFEYKVPTIVDFEARIQRTSSVFPYIVAVNESGEIIGYAYASRYRERAAYDWVIELSVYVAESEHHRGAGKALYQRLLALLKALNYQRAYACITYPNPASVSFHETFGFQEIGVFQKSGYKFGSWYGIVWMDLPLQETDEVLPVKKVSELDSSEIERILKG